MCKKIIIDIIKFIRDLMLWLIAYILTPIVEIITFIVVVFKYGIGALNYFKGEAYSFDVRSASRNRSLWNWLFVNKNGYKFTADTNKSISWHIGLNSFIGGLTLFGWAMYYFLYIIDFTNWFSDGHCRACVTEKELNDYYLGIKK